MMRRMMLRRANDVGATRFYVRPVGQTYGTGDGTSYANAWSGAGQVNYSLVEGNELAICGTHTESFTILANCKIYMNDINQSGNIDATSLNTGINVVGYNVDFYACDVQNASIQNIYAENGVFNFFDGIFDNSGNQGIQHWTNSIATYHGNVRSNGNGDEGFSGHENCQINIASDCVFQSRDNVQASINCVQNSRVVIDGICDFANNGEGYDIWMTNATTSKSCGVIINNPNNVFIQKVSATNGAEVIINAGKYNEVECINGTGLSNLETNNCSIASLNLSGQTHTLTNTFANLDVLFVQVNSVTNVERSHIFERNTYFRFSVASSTFNLKTSLVRSLNVNHQIELLSGTSTIESVVIVGNANNKFAIVVNSGYVINKIKAINFIGGINNGRGILTQQNLTLENSIFFNTSIRTFVQNSAATLTLDSCVTFNGGSNLGTGTLVENNGVTGDPLFTDPTNFDYSLQAGSPALGIAVNSNGEVGIDTAIWGDENTIPNITEGTRTAPYNTGAYIQ